MKIAEKMQVKDEDVVYQGGASHSGPKGVKSGLHLDSVSRALLRLTTMPCGRPSLDQLNS
jgi:hypothetical protein